MYHHCLLLSFITPPPPHQSQTYQIDVNILFLFLRLCQRLHHHPLPSRIPPHFLFLFHCRTPFQSHHAPHTSPLTDPHCPHLHRCPLRRHRQLILLLSLQNPATQREKDVFKIQQHKDDLFKIQQEREEEVFKIQQERERNYSKSSKRERAELLKIRQ